MSITNLPIISNYSNIAQLGFTTDEILLIDAPSRSVKKPKIAHVPLLTKRDDVEAMEVGNDEEEDKENTVMGGGPLETSFLTLEKLQKNSGIGKKVCQLR